MTPSQQFLKYAADCESMAKLTLNGKNDPDWHCLAERWVRCAQWAEGQTLAAQHAQEKRKHKDDQQRERNFS